MRAFDTCVFCGHQGADFAPEHWFPQWLNRVLFPTYGSGGVSHQLRGRDTWEGDVFELTTEHVCNACNTGWLSDIETRSKSSVLPLILNTPNRNTFSQASLRKAATWCYLKVISLELTRPSDEEPTHDGSVYRLFRTHKRPPFPNCSIAIGVRDIKERSPIFVTFSSQGGVYFSSRPSGLPQADGYHTTLVVGHLVIDVFGTGLPLNLDVDHGDGLHVVWPHVFTGKGHKFSWPPERRFRVGSEGLVLQEGHLS